MKSPPQPVPPPSAPLIIAYHSVSPSPRSPLAVKTTDFAQQMRWLYRRGFRAVGLSRLCQGPLSGKPVVLTFDDGYADCLIHAAPILAELDWRGVVFVISDYVGTARDFPWYAGLPRSSDGSELSLSWEQLHTLLKMNWEIGSHTATHPVLTSLPLGEAKKEIEDSKCLLELKLGTPVESFCYPKSQASVELAALVQGAGYRCAVKSGTPLPQAGFYALPRVAVYGDDSMASFAVKVRWGIRMVNCWHYAPIISRFIKRTLRAWSWK